MVAVDVCQYGGDVRGRATELTPREVLTVRLSLTTYMTNGSTIGKDYPPSFFVLGE